MADFWLFQTLVSAMAQRRRLTRGERFAFARLHRRYTGESLSAAMRKKARK
jgi:hypothetical protein